MINKISSKENAVIKKIKQLELKKYREKYSQFLLEGINLIHEALKNNGILDVVVFKDAFVNEPHQKEIIDLLVEKNISVFNVSDSLFEHICDTENPQGIIAVAKKPYFNFEEVLKKQDSNILILDRIQDPGNLGTILRTADAAGMEGVISMKGSVDLYNSKTVRAAAGSVFRIPVTQVEDVDQLLLLLKKHQKRIIATSPRGENYYFHVDIYKNSALVIGNEASGVSEALLRSAQHIVKIPMLRDTESLNASIAASLVMYEMVRQKMNP